MPLFRSRGPSGRSSPLERELNRVIAYGQFQLDPQSVDPASFGNLEADLYPLAISDPAAFMQDLTGLVLPAGGLATYGGARLAGSLLGWEFKDAHYLSMLDAALEWRRAEGTGAAWLAPYELQRWEQLHGVGSW
jgi:hypothetical protein